MSLLVMGLSHRSAPVDVLEQAAIDHDTALKILDEIHESDHISEAVVVATCNRLELYADVATFHGGLSEAGSVLSARTGAPLDLLTPYMYVHYEDRAVAHLFQVVSGLDSMAVGEAQILGQVRDAFRTAQTSGTTGRVLTELFQTALRVGKRGHAETDIDAAGRSLVTLGLAQVMPAIGGIEGRQVLVVGAGSMAALAATTIAREKARLLVANRTVGNAARVAGAVGGRAVDMSDVPSVLDDVDLLVSCTGAAGVVLPYDVIAESVHRRAGRPLGIIDLALPHDVDRSVTQLPGVVLADLATLAEVAAADGGVVADEVEAVRSIIADEVAAFATARRVAQVAPTVVALRSMADDVVEAELARMSARLPDIDERTRAEVSSTVRRVVDKLLHAPTVRVKELAAQPEGASYESALRQLFALDERSVQAVVTPEPEARR